MNKRIRKVKPLPEYKLLLTFEDNVEKVFDVSPYLSNGKFTELKDENMFNTVHISFDTVEWNNGLDLCPEVLYNESKVVDKVWKIKNELFIENEWDNLDDKYEQNPQH